MKKILTIAIAAALCLSMLACAKKTDEKTDSTEADNVTESAAGESTPEENDEPSDPEENDESSEDESLPEEDEPVYSLSDFEGLYVYDNMFLHVDTNGNWEITTGGEENMSGTLYEKDSAFYVDIYGQTIEVSLDENGAIEIMGQSFTPTTASQLPSDEIDMAFFEGDWYLNGDIDADFYYHVNADGSWNQFERSSEGSDNIDSGRTVHEDGNKYTLISDFGPTSVAEYDENEDIMYINGDAYSR